MAVWDWLLALFGRGPGRTLDQLQIELDAKESRYRKIHFRLRELASARVELQAKAIKALTDDDTRVYLNDEDRLEIEDTALRSERDQAEREIRDIREKLATLATTATPERTQRGRVLLERTTAVLNERAKAEIDIREAEDNARKALGAAGDAIEQARQRASGGPSRIEAKLAAVRAARQQQATPRQEPPTPA